MKTLIALAPWSGRLHLLMVWLTLATLTLMLLPDSLIHSMALEQWQPYYLPAAFIGAIISASYFLSQLLIHLVTQVRDYRVNNALQGNIERMVRRLDYNEKAVLREFVIQRKNVLALPLNEMAVMNLVRSGVLIPASVDGSFSGNRIEKLMISVDARPLLTHDVIGLPRGPLSEAQLDALKAARPEYARQNVIKVS